MSKLNGNNSNRRFRRVPHPNEVPLPAKPAAHKPTEAAPTGVRNAAVRKPTEAAPAGARKAAARKPAEVASSGRKKAASRGRALRIMRALAAKLWLETRKLPKKALNWVAGIFRKPGVHRKTVKHAPGFRIAMWMSASAVLVAVTLLIVLSPGGEAASAPGSSASAETSAPMYTPVPTTEPELSMIATTEPDPDVTPVPSPTPKPPVSHTATQRPTATPTRKPTPTPTRKPTPTPTRKPTPTPTQKPTATPTIKPTESETTTSTSTGTDMNSLVSYYIVTADSYYNTVGYYSNHYEYTDAELYMLAQIIQTESGGESTTGKIAVGNVVINRVLCGRFGNSIDAVKGGFAYHEDTVPKQGAIDAAHAVLDDEVWVVPQNTYYFKASGGTWSSHTYWGKIGNHYFYTHNYSGRYNGTSIPEALFERVYKYAQYGCKKENRVYRIQYMLKALGYSVSTDKCFGKGTHDALMDFQKSKGLTADGVAGPSTVEALITAFGVDKYLAEFS